jgi:hypothetical protein
MVGRTPWSAAGPLAGFLKVGNGLILRENSGSRGTRADQGVRPTDEVAVSQARSQNGDGVGVQGPTHCREC